MSSAEVSTEPASPPAAYLVTGGDPSLVAEEVRSLVASLVSDRDASDVVEEHGLPAGAELEVGPIVDALSTPPFLTDRRVVVVRDAGRLAAADGSRLVQRLSDPLPGVVLVLAAGDGTVPAALVKAVQKAGTAGPTGTVIDTAVGFGRQARTNWFGERLRRAPVRLDPAAAALVSEHLGEDVARLAGILGMLASAYGDGSRISIEQIRPYLGEQGAVAPWDLADAIDRGEDEKALVALGRMTGAGERHPLVILAMLLRQYEAMLRLDGSTVTSPEEAASLIGERSVFVAKKRLDQGRRLGTERIMRAVLLIADADLDLRGQTALPDEAVLQVLVARLARLSGSRGRSGRTPSSTRSASGSRGTRRVTQAG